MTPTFNPELLQRAQTEALRSKRRTSAVLEELLALDPAAFVGWLGQVSGYPVCSMQQLHDMQPDFSWVSFVACQQREVLQRRHLQRRHRAAQRHAGQSAGAGKRVQHGHARAAAAGLAQQVEVVAAVRDVEPDLDRLDRAVELDLARQLAAGQIGPLGAESRRGLVADFRDAIRLYTRTQ